MAIPKLYLTLVLVFFVCSTAACTSAPQVIHHPAPEFTLATIPAELTGCFGGDSGYAACPPESAVGQKGCDYLASPGVYLGGLEPAFPINLCLNSDPAETAQFIYRDGCLMPQFVRYAIQENQSLRVLSNQADLAAAYAPILSKDEALSFALAATGLAAYFDLQAPDNMRYFTDRLEDSHVEVTPDGYIVNLFHYKLCGCGPHTTTAVEMLVRQDGRLEELSRQPVFEDPSQDGLCVD